MFICPITDNGIMEMSAPAGPLPVHLVIRAVCGAVGIAEADLVGFSRRQEFLWPRFSAFKISRETTGASIAQIGRIFGGRDWRSITNGIDRCSYLLRNNRQFLIQHYAAVDGVSQVGEAQ